MHLSGGDGLPKALIPVFVMINPQFSITISKSDSSKPRQSSYLQVRPEKSKSKSKSNLIAGKSRSATTVSECMNNLCRLVSLIRRSSHFSRQRFPGKFPFGISFSSVANRLISSSDEDEVEEGDDSNLLISGQALKTQLPTTIAYDPQLANSISLIGCVDRPVQVYKTKGTTFGVYTTLSAICPHHSNEKFRIPVEMWGDMAKVCIKLLKPNDFIFVSGQLWSDFIYNENGNGTLNSKIIVKEWNYVAQQDTTCKKPDELQSEAYKNLEESQSPSCQKSEDSQLNQDPTCQKPEKLQSEACTSFEELQSASCQKFKVSQLKGGKASMCISTKELELWQVFFSNPHKWWDNRKNKKSPRAPDFKHRDTRESLWLGQNVPPWVKRQLLMLDLKMAEECQSGVTNEGESGKERYKNRLYLWQVFFANPHEWWDLRNKKRTPSHPDFKHKDTGEALWLRYSDPPWVQRQLQLLDSRMAEEKQGKDLDSCSSVSKWTYDEQMKGL